MSTINPGANTRFSYMAQITTDPAAGRENRKVEYTGATTVLLDDVTIAVPDAFSSLDEYLASFRERSEACLNTPRIFAAPPKYGPDDCNYKNDLGHDWLNLSVDFMKELASKVELDKGKIQVLDITDMGWYANRALEFFGGYASTEVSTVVEDGQTLIKHTYFHADTMEKSNALQNQFMDAIRELAQQMQDGKGDSLDTLTTRLTINGVDMTVSELVAVQKGIGQIADAFVNRNGYEQFAAAGLSVSAVRKFAESGFSKDIADMVAKCYETRVNNHFDRMSERVTLPIYDRDKIGAENYYYQTINMNPRDPHTLNAAALRKFSNLDVSSDAAFQKSYTDAMDWFKNEIELFYAKGNPGGNAAGAIRDIANYLNSQMSLCAGVKSVDVLA